MTQTTTWNNNALEFARLLTEIVATHNINIPALSEAMHLPEAAVQELIDRAEAVWDRKKNSKPSGIGVRKPPVGILENLSVPDADRILGLSDQFLEEWEDDCQRLDPECVERRFEYDAIRPLWMYSPKLFELLIKAVDELESMDFFIGNKLQMEIKAVVQKANLVRFVRTEWMRYVPSYWSDMSACPQLSSSN